MFPWSGPLYRIFNETLSDGRVWLVFLLSWWQFTAMDMIIMRWDDYWMIKNERAEALKEIEMGNVLDAFKNDLGESREVSGSMV